LAAKAAVAAAINSSSVRGVATACPFSVTRLTSFPSRHRGLDVLLGHPALGAGAFDLAEVDPQRLGVLERGRGGVDVGAGVGWGSGGRGAGEGGLKLVVGALDQTGVVGEDAN